MNKTDIEKVKALLSVSHRIVIIPHKNPDGDAIGSTLGLSQFLKKLGHTATVIAPNDYPKFLKWMPGQNEILNFERRNAEAKKQIREASLIFTLDFNDLSRTGDMATALEAASGDFIMIDHHQQPADYAVVTYSDVKMSSTCEMVYNFIEALDGLSHLNKDIATCLYTGIMTDTGSFKYASTTGRTHQVIADLINQGVENTLIHQRVFDSNSQSRLRLLGTALNNLVVLPQYSTAYITLLQEDLDKHSYTKGDTEGFVNYGLTLDGIQFAVIFIENREEGIIKISFRSKGSFSVNQFARKHFNGGGHDNAAGGRSDVSMQETVSLFSDLIASYKELKAQ